MRPLSVIPSWKGLALLLLLLSLIPACTGLTRLGGVEGKLANDTTLLREPFPWQGEEMTFDVSIAKIKVMNMELKAGHQGIAEDGAPYVILDGNGQSFGLFAIGYSLDDWSKSIIHPRTWRPYYAIKHINERKKERTYRVHYLYEERMAKVEKTKNKKITRRAISIPQNTFDVISFIYAMRSMPLKPGVEQTWVVYDGWKLNHIYLVVQEKEEIYTELGFYNCYRIDIYREILNSHRTQGALAGAFLDPVLSVKKKKEFVGNVWITADERRIPVQLGIQVKRLGDILIKLRTYIPSSMPGSPPTEPI